MKSYFTEQRIVFTERDIRHDPQAYREWRDRLHGDIVPVIVFNNGELIVDGCDIPAIKRALLKLRQPGKLQEQPPKQKSPH